MAAKPDHIDVLVTERNIHESKENMNSSIFMQNKNINCSIDLKD